eukprot:IDg5161t1
MGVGWVCARAVGGCSIYARTAGGGGLISFAVGCVCLFKWHSVRHGLDTRCLLDPTRRCSRVAIFGIVAVASAVPAPVLVAGVSCTVGEAPSCTRYSRGRCRGWGLG